MQKLDSSQGLTPAHCPSPDSQSKGSVITATFPGPFTVCRLFHVREASLEKAKDPASCVKIKEHMLTRGSTRQEVKTLEKQRQEVDRSQRSGSKTLMNMTTPIKRLLEAALRERPSSPSGAHRLAGKPLPAQEQHKADCVSGKGEEQPRLKCRQVKG